MQDDLDRRVGEHLGQRRGVERIVGERVQQRDVAALGVVAGQRHLDQAELGAVAPLAHELGVDAEASRFAGAAGDVGCTVRHTAGPYLCG